MRFLTAVGALTTVCFCFYIFLLFYSKIKQIIKKQYKIKSLCRHEYVVDYIWDGKKLSDYHFVCRKCGKTKEMKIWKQEEIE